MHKRANYGGREIRQMYESLGPRECSRQFSEALRTREVAGADFSVRDLFENLVEDGERIVKAWENPKRRNSSSIMEASQAVDTSAFSNITGQIIYNAILEGYENPEFLWKELFTDMSSTVLNSERLPGIGGTGDEAEVVDEGQPYPIVGLNEEYVDFGPMLKRGFIIPITREIIVADRTGLLLERASESGYHYLGINMEKRALNVFTGQSGFNTYTRNGANTNTYQTSGGYINQQSGNALTSWRSMNAAELLFDSMTDPNTGEPMIVSGQMDIVVPTALKMDAFRILNVNGIGQVDNTASTATVRQYGPNPLTAGSMVHATGLRVLSNAYIKKQTGSSTGWYFGQPKKAFLKRTAWEIETEQAATNSEAMFVADIWMRYKCSEESQFGVKNPRYVTYNTP